MVVGFVLQPSYRVERGRAVVTLHGKLADGRSFLVRDTREAPRFWIRKEDAARAEALGARLGRARPARRTMSGDRVVPVVTGVPPDLRQVRDRLVAAGIETFEADVRFAYRYLMDRGIRGAVLIEGEGRPGDGVDVVFDDPEVSPADWTPELTVLSFDIETDPRARRLLSIALAGAGASEVLLLTPPGRDCPDGASAYPTEKALLEEFVRRVRALDPDVLTGWNVIDFDLAVLDAIAGKVGVALEIGRGAGRLRIRRAAGTRGSSAASVPGRLVLDGIDLLRGAFLRLESYSLGAVAREILGESKLIEGPDRAVEILRAFRDDRVRFVAYNLKDAQLVLEILERTNLVRLAVERSRLTGMPPDRVTASIASFDFLYLSALGKRGIVAPTVRPAPAGGVATSGGHVLEPKPGLYDNVLVFDFRSLYPSIIRTVQIDPLGRLLAAGDPGKAIVAPNGARFSREPGILPAMLDDLFPRRERARAAGDAVASQAIKILMNSFYGVLGTPACRFAHPELANAITGFGREILLWAKGRFEAGGHEVLYGDTDSLFVLSGVGDAADARDLGIRLARDVNGDLREHVRRGWGVDSRLVLELEHVYRRLLLPAVRHGTAGARKRYAGLVDDGVGGRVVFTGMESVRRDWTALAREVQRELYERLFRDRPVEDYLRDVVARLRAGALDDDLVYTKGLGKPVDAYTAAIPPHVAAARKLRRRPGRRISYVVTTAGPEPAGERASPIDHEHYVQKQIRPVAEPVLAILGLEFDRVVGDDTQARLF